MPFDMILFVTSKDELMFEGNNRNIDWFSKKN